MQLKRHSQGWLRTACLRIALHRPIELTVGIGVLVVTLGIPEAIIGAFLLIVRLAISAWGTLAAILGTGTAALAAG